MYITYIFLFLGSNNNNNQAVEPRREFISYCLSLMRAHSNEHGDSLPVLDVSSLKHVAYVLDALVYYMRADTAAVNCQALTPPILLDSTENDSWIIDQVSSISIIIIYCIQFVHLFCWVFM